MSEKNRVGPGINKFIVQDIEPKTFQSGNKGFVAHLEIHSENGAKLRTREHFTILPQTKWKTEQFCDCLGIPYVEVPDVGATRGKIGNAVWFENDKGYLDVDKFLPKPDTEEKPF